MVPPNAHSFRNVKICNLFFFCLLICVWNRVSGNPPWPWAHWIVKIASEFPILLPPSLKYWISACAPACCGCNAGNWTQSCMNVGKHSTNWTAFPACKYFIRSRVSAGLFPFVWNNLLPYLGYVDLCLPWVRYLTFLELGQVYSFKHSDSVYQLSNPTDNGN